MKQIITLLIAAVCLAATTLPASAGKVKIHMLSGSKEYQSEPSLRAWAEWLIENKGYDVTVTHGPDRATEVEGLEHLKHADLLVVYCRRWELVPEQAEQVMNWIAKGKPILALRTASHAFQFYQEFDKELLGGDYDGHIRKEVDMSVVKIPENKTHPILKDIKPWERLGKLYRNPEIAKDVILLLESDSDATESQPLAWARIVDGRKIFYSSLGYPHDFENEQFLNLINNSVKWLLDK